MLASMKTKPLGEKERSRRTEPATIGLNARIRELLGLKLVAHDLALAVTLGPRIIHLESPDGGGGASLALAILPVHVQRVLRLPRDVDLPLLLLRHLRVGEEEIGKMNYAVRRPTE